MRTIIRVANRHSEFQQILPAQFAQAGPHLPQREPGQVREPQSVDRFGL
jgi:hypothetical protein